MRIPGTGQGRKRTEQDERHRGNVIALEARIGTGKSGYIVNELLGPTVSSMSNFKACFRFIAGAKGKLLHLKGRAGCAASGSVFASHAHRCVFVCVCVIGPHADNGNIASQPAWIERVVCAA